MHLVSRSEGVQVVRDDAELRVGVQQLRQPFTVELSIRSEQQRRTPPTANDTAASGIAASGSGRAMPRVV